MPVNLDNAIRVAGDTIRCEVQQSDRGYSGVILAGHTELARTDPLESESEALSAVESCVADARGDDVADDDTAAEEGGDE